MANNFIQLQYKQWQDIYSHYQLLLSDPSLTGDDILASITQKIQTFGFSLSVSYSIANAFINSVKDNEDSYIDLSSPSDSAASSLSPNNASTSSPRAIAILSTQDITYLENALPRLSEDAQLAKLLISYAIHSRMNPHHSNWIKCDKKDRSAIFYLASLSKLPASKQQALINKLHSSYGLDMRVVGSNTPIPCFCLSWQASQPPQGSNDNPLIELGILSPRSISDFYDSLLEKYKSSTNSNKQ